MLQLIRKFISISLLALCISVAAEAGENKCQKPENSESGNSAATSDNPNWNPAALELSLAYAYGQRSSAIVIVDDGVIVAECYWPVASDAGSFYANLLGEVQDSGAPVEDVASLQKSIFSLLVGTAIDNGQIDMDKPVSTYLKPGWSKATADEESAITVKHLLSMTSGLTPMLEFQAPAGSVWLYNTNAYSVLVDVLEAVTGDDVSKLTKIWLTKPAGMNDTAWRKRPWVTPAMDANLIGIYTTARDLARFGQLMLAKGSWQGTELVSENYINAAIKPSQALNPAYGLLWWLNGQSLLTKEGLDENEMLVSAAPADMYAALGALGRKVFVVPSRNLVVVRLGDATPDEEFNQKFWELLLTAMPET
jgi:CubicO group peptidase (beta-lactamase class C family)